MSWADMERLRQHTSDAVFDGLPFDGPCIWPRADQVALLDALKDDPLLHRLGVGLCDGDDPETLKKTAVKLSELQGVAHEGGVDTDVAAAAADFSARVANMAEGGVDMIRREIAAAVTVVLTHVADGDWDSARNGFRNHRAIRELVASWDRLGARRPSSKPWWQIKDRTDAKVLSVQTVLVSAMQTVVNKQYMLLRVRMDGHRLAEGLDDGQDGKSSGEAHIYACIDWAMTAARMMLWQMKALTEVDAQAARASTTHEWASAEACEARVRRVADASAASAAVDLGAAAAAAAVGSGATAKAAADWVAATTAAASAATPEEEADARVALQAAADAAMVAVGARTATGTRTGTGTGTGTGSAPPTPPQPPQPPPPWRESPWRESGPDDRGLLKMVRTAFSESCLRYANVQPAGRVARAASGCGYRRPATALPPTPPTSIPTSGPRARTRRRALLWRRRRARPPGRRGRRVHWRRLLHAAFHR